MLEGNVEIGQHLPLRHKRQDLIDMRVRIDVVQPHPGAEAGERLGKGQEPRLALLAAPRAFGITYVEAVGARVLRDDQQLLDACADQPLSLPHDVADRAARELAPQMRDDAEAAGVVAAFGDLQIGVVARGKPDALRRQQIEEGIVRARHGLVHVLHHRFVLLGPGYGEHARMDRENAIQLDPEAAGDDDLAVLRQRLADGRKQLLLGGVEKAAGVDHYSVSALVLRRQLIALGAELGNDALQIDQALGQPRLTNPILGGPLRGAALFSGISFGAAFGMGALIGKRATLVCRRVWSAATDEG